MRYSRFPLLLLIAFLAILPGPAGGKSPRLPVVNNSQLLQSSDLLYLGAFAFPAGDEWAYSGHALAFYPAGDGASTPDDFPGSLYAVGHAWQQLVAEISIPAPLITDDYAALPVAEVLQPLADITGGWLGNCTFAPDCIYREVAGLAWLPQNDKIAWNVRDWYNATAYDQDSLGWSNRDMTAAQGVWHIGPRNDEAFHNARTSNYLFHASDTFAAAHLGGKSLIAGNHRPAGALGGSQGPTLFASAPWTDGDPPGDPPASGQALAALALLYYPTNGDCTDNQFDKCAFPGYRVDDNWGGGAWVEAGAKAAVLIFGRKGLGDNCYGIPGEDCPASQCGNDKGWHSDPYEPQILFYDPDKLAATVQGNQQPWETVPYAVYRPSAEMFDPACGILSDVAYDAANRLIYVTESNAGPFGATAVHVWQVEKGETPPPQSLFLPLVAGNP